MTSGRVATHTTAASIHARVPAEAASLAPIRRAVTALAASAGLAADRVEDVRVAVTEACANVVVHAYEGGTGIIEVGAAVDDGMLHVRVRDEGRGLVPRLRHTSPGLRLGLQMMSALADEVSFHAEEGGGTSVRMAFRVPQSGR